MLFRLMVDFVVLVSVSTLIGVACLSLLVSLKRRCSTSVTRR